MHDPDRQRRRREWARMADLSTLGLVFPVALVLGYLAGRAVGGWLGAPKAGALVGVFFGLAAAFYNLIEVVKRLDREDRAALGAGDEDDEPPSGS